MPEPVLFKHEEARRPQICDISSSGETGSALAATLVHPEQCKGHKEALSGCTKVDQDAEGVEVAEDSLKQVTTRNTGGTLLRLLKIAENTADMATTGPSILNKGGPLTTVTRPNERNKHDGAYSWSSGNTKQLKVRGKGGPPQILSDLCFLQKADSIISQVAVLKDEGGNIAEV